MPSVRIKNLGGANEIGASASQIEFLGNINQNALLDAGIRMINKRCDIQGKRITMSRGHADPDVRIDAALITHGHSDHHGNLPYLWPGIIDKNPDTKAYMTRPTFFTAGNLWLDNSFRMANKNLKVHPDFQANFNRGMRMILEQTKDILIEEPGWVEIFPGVDAYFGSNGHIRGSAFIVIRVDVGNGEYTQIMFSGDVSVYDSPTVKGMKIPEEFIGKLDAMFVEATYGDRVLIPRSEEEDRMADLAKETIEQGGICLTPGFGVGRCPDATIAQWIRGVRPLYVDGQGKQMLDLYAGPNGCWCELDHMSDVDLESSDIRYVQNRGERKELIYEGGGFSVITTAGMMMEGSCAWQYAIENRFLENPLNSVLQTGYQAEGTEGWDLQEAVKHGEPFFVSRHKSVMVEAKVPRQLQLSSHADGGQIANIVNILQPKKVFIIHGNDNGREGLKYNLLNLGFKGEIHLPNNGDVIEI